MKVVVGVSGGVDSMYLLHTLLPVYGNDLVVAHVNYHYRADSDLDEMLVTDECKKHGIQCFCLDAPKYPATGFEEWARDVRYAFFKSIMRGFETHQLFLGHNANDQAETVLMNRQRGCGLYGEGGMRKMSAWGQYQIHRPLLDTTKKGIYELAKSAGLNWREDSSNTDTKFTRNAIRATLSDADVLRINEEAKIARTQYYDTLQKAYLMYKIDHIEDGFIIDKPTEKLYWNLIVYDNLRLHLELTQNHFNLLHSDASCTRVVNLPSGWRVNKRKKNRVYFTKSNK